MQVFASWRRAFPSRLRGATLLLTLIVLALVGIVAGRWALQTTITLGAAQAPQLALETQAIAEGVAEQWQQRLADPQVPRALLRTPTHWALGAYQVTLIPASCQEKLHVAFVPPARWLPVVRQAGITTPLVEDPEDVLTYTAYSALEVLLAPQVPSASEAYQAPPGQVALGEVLTCWGDGKVDLNYSSREVLAARLPEFTEAQLSGILRLRQQAPLVSLTPLAEALSLSAHQQEVLSQVATTDMDTLELLIWVRKGPWEHRYHGVVCKGSPGRVLELRALE